MFANSPRIISNQTEPHSRLDETVARHLREPYRRAPSRRGRAAFALIAQRLTQDAFMLDAGCGTGASTFALAREFPEHWVVGLDKSIARLESNRKGTASSEMPNNAILLHCELVDFWQLAAEAGLRCECQFLLYPNPWPKPQHLKRRWHAHPVLPAILALGGQIELRTNWRVYAEEFSFALGVAGLQSHLESFTAAHPLTPFERKYAASDHALWRCRAQPSGKLSNGTKFVGRAYGTS